MTVVGIALIPIFAFVVWQAFYADRARSLSARFHHHLLGDLQRAVREAEDPEQAAARQRAVTRAEAPERFEDVDDLDETWIQLATDPCRRREVRLRALRMVARRMPLDDLLENLEQVVFLQGLRRTQPAEVRLIRFLSDSIDADAQIAAAYGLLRMGGPVCLAPLRRAWAKDPDEGVRRAAKAAYRLVKARVDPTALAGGTLALTAPETDPAAKGRLSALDGARGAVSPASKPSPVPAPLRIPPTRMD